VSANAKSTAPGYAYFDRLNAERLARNLVRPLEKLGHKVTLECQPAMETLIEEDGDLQMK
jgi:hypothetical protein